MLTNISIHGFSINFRPTGQLMWWHFLLALSLHCLRSSRHRTDSVGLFLLALAMEFSTKLIPRELSASSLVWRVALTKQILLQRYFVSMDTLVETTLPL
jgi:hypothetical protein